MKNKLYFTCLVVLIIAFSIIAFASEDPNIQAVKESLKKDFPAVTAQGINATPIEGLYEVLAGTNVFYYNPSKGIILFGEMYSKDWKSQTANMRSNLLASTYKDSQFDGVNAPSPIPGMNQVMFEQNLMFYNAKSGTKFIGEVYTREGTNLTQDIRAQIKAQAMLKDIPLDKAIKVGSGKNSAIIFTDVDCPYCRKLEDFLKDKKDLTQYVFLFPLEQLHPQSHAKSLSVMCSNDRGKAYMDAISGKLDNVEIAPCSDAKAAASLNEYKSLAQKLGIQGTPFLFVNGEVVRGVDTVKINKLLGETTSSN